MLFLLLIKIKKKFTGKASLSVFKVTLYFASLKAVQVLTNKVKGRSNSMNEVWLFFSIAPEESIEIKENILQIL